MKKIGIFCSASESIDKMYFDSARQIGEWIGQTGKTLIYGGASLGLMECVARAVKVGHTGGTTRRCGYTRRNIPCNSRRFHRIPPEKSHLLQ